jgi:putative methyltransferase (TIGR04325 family)
MLSRVVGRAPDVARRDPAQKSEPLVGYEAPELVDVVFRKTVALDRDALWGLPESSATDLTGLGVLFAARTTRRHPLRVLDFGGACGLHYRVVRTMFPDLSLKWAVVETPAMAKRAQELATDELGFFASIDAAATHLGGVDLVHSAGTIQYLEDPLRGARQLCSLGAAVLLWTRMTTALTQGDGDRSMQSSRLVANGPGPAPHGTRDRDVEYQVTRVAERDFMALHSAYDLAWRFGDSSAFLFRLRELSPQ